MTNSFLFDKLLPFSKRGSVEKLNIFQVYIIRDGIGISISNKICKYASTHSSIKFSNYYINDINENIKNIFILSTIQHNLDNELHEKMISTLQESINIYDYRGRMYLAKLPINGQRRRSNKSTAKKIRLKYIK